VNPAFSALLDRTADELTARPLLHFVHPDDRAATASALERAAAGEPVTFENRQRHRDGGWRRVAWTGDGRLARPDHTSAQDLTASDAAAADHRRSTGEIVALQAALDLRAAEVDDLGRRLSALERELASFSRVVSYDLRAPLRRIDELARAVRDEHGDGLDAAGTARPRRRRRARESPGAAPRRRARAVGSRAPRGRSVRGRHGGPRQDAVEAARRADPDRDVLVSIGDLAPAAGDLALLRELVATLIGNAFAATRACDHPCIDVGSVDADGTPVYYVRDNGVGFDGRQAERLFRRSSACRCPPSRTAPVSGWGSSSRSWSGTAGACGPRGARAMAPRSSSLCRARGRGRAPPRRRSPIDARPVLTRRFGT
jgi:signal transduction histidine kinase